MTKCWGHSDNGRSSCSTCLCVYVCAHMCEGEREAVCEAVGPQCASVCERAGMCPSDHMCAPGSVRGVYTGVCARECVHASMGGCVSSWL